VTTRIIRGPKEDQLHLSVAQLLDWILLPPAFYTTFPAGWGVLSPMMAQRLKRSGLKAGMPDMLLFYEQRCYGIELKTGKNAVSPDQKETIHRLGNAGVPVWVCRSAEDVIDVLQVIGLPTRPLAGAGGFRCPPNINERPLAGTSVKRADIGADGGADGAA
jgi:hypothetical protein